MDHGHHVPQPIVGAVRAGSVLPVRGMRRAVSPSDSISPVERALFRSVVFVEARGQVFFACVCCGLYAERDLSRARFPTTASADFKRDC